MTIKPVHFGDTTFCGSFWCCLFVQEFLYFFFCVACVDIWLWYRYASFGASFLGGFWLPTASLRTLWLLLSCQELGILLLYILRTPLSGEKKLTLHKTRCRIVVNTLPCSSNCVLVHCRQHEFVVLDAFSRCCESICLGLVHTIENTFSTVSHIAEWTPS